MPTEDQIALAADNHISHVKDYCQIFIQLARVKDMTTADRKQSLLLLIDTIEEQIKEAKDLLNS